MKTSKLKPSIIIVDNSVAITGALKSILNTSKHLQEYFNFIFVLPSGSAGSALVLENGFIVHELNFVEISKRISTLLSYFPALLWNSFKLKKIVAKYDAKVIHMNDFYNLTGIIVKIFTSRITLITHVRFLPQKFPTALANIWKNLNIRYSSIIVCVSEAVKEFFPLIKKIEVIPDSVPIREFYPKKEILFNNTNEIKLLYLSNFINGKGQDYALQAFEIAYKKNNNLSLLFIGGDMGLKKNKLFRQSLEDKVKTIAQEESVSFLPFTHDVEKTIKNADILLNFSESESFSLTCLDALFYGTPLIATDCGGPAELFENGKSGHLVPNKDVESMARAIIDLASNIERRRAFASEGKKYVRDKYSLSANCIKLKRLYDSF